MPIPTALSGRFIVDAETASASRRQVLILDCCYSGALASDFLAKDVSSLDIMLDELSGSGRVILTASSATQPALEHLGSDHSPTSSAFTRALIKGLDTGAADLNGDGIVGRRELYEYAADAVRTSGQPTPRSLRMGRRRRRYPDRTCSSCSWRTRHPGRTHSTYHQSVRDGSACRCRRVDGSIE